MRALVTGASGFIGAHLVKCLVDQGHWVRGFVRETSDLRGLDGIDAEIAVGDILEVDSLIKAAKGCDIIFHVAAFFSYARHTLEELMTTATAGTVNVLEAAKEAGVQRVVLTSTSVLFGSTLDSMPLDESQSVPEPDPAPYILSKASQAKVGFERAAALGIDLVAACPTICVGPHDYNLSESNAVIVSYLMDPFKATWPGGCNIVSVHDVVMGHLLIAERGLPGEQYLLGSQNLHWPAIHRIISELCGLEGPLMTANHTLCYLAGVFHEFTSAFTSKRPQVSRVQAKMVGRYYWYRHDRAAALGYVPMPARQAMANAISWLVKSDHISGSLRNSMRLSQEIYDQRL